MRGVERIAAVTAPRRDDANGGLVVLERADLDRRGMCAQEDVAAEVEAVLRVERRMIFRKIERIEVVALGLRLRDRKSTRLNSSHLVISYAVFCLKKKTT